MKFTASKPNSIVSIVDEVDTSTTIDRTTFKIFKVAFFTNPGTLAHGLDYAPAFTYYVETSTGLWVERAIGDYYENDALVNVDSTNIYSFSSRNIYVVLFADSLEE